MKIKRKEVYDDIPAHVLIDTPMRQVGHRIWLHKMGFLESHEILWFIVYGKEF